MTRIKVWDIPTRLFHWSLAAAFLAAFIITQTVSDEDPLFAVHAILGLIIGFMVLLRIIWGFAGTRYARFSSFAFSPGEFARYMRDAFSQGGNRYTGHNPGSGYAVFLMLILLSGIVVTGLLGHRGGESFEELHEAIAYAMIAVVGAHLAGVLLHTIRHKENIVLSMVTGSKEGGESEGISSARPLAGAVFLLLTGLWTSGLFSAYDPGARQTVLPVVGTTVQLGETEGEEREREGHERDHHEDRDD